LSEYDLLWVVSVASTIFYDVTITGMITTVEC